ncbi:DMT family transporter [Aliiglaciecola sp. LCG003]|uniref:DMT family transporter n=1 Tax=Aliiglaciecola sp. LCG003 TaxID=3053655 RepID=UPI002573A6CA|nr:DMT family transporter [Aliiglaciecola sp. LCG003]WJG09369.1 DMT family transporter [Aliiglaciecola sp. LCG003]
MSNIQLFISCTLIWGSTWIAITYQLGEVDPALSVAYRFTIASLVLGAYCWFKKLPLKMPTHIHLKMAAVGLCLYTLDYSFLYQSQKYIISAVLALMSSSIIYLNIIMRKIFLKKPIRPEVLIGATFGLLGMALIFLPEFDKVQNDEFLAFGILLACISFFFAALGNVVSERILDQGTPVIQMNFWAMTYGLVFLYGFAFFSGAEFILPKSTDYYVSLLFLAVFGSVLAFGAFMKLMQQIGSDKAAYVVLMYPLVALFLSTLFEGYQWQLQAVIGVLIVLFGNAIAMGKIGLLRFKIKSSAN